MGDYTHEVVHEIWHDHDGWRFEVGPDRDSLDCLEIRCIGTDGKVESRVLMECDAAELIYEALGQILGKDE